jgi:hypothetical protein
MKRTGGQQSGLHTTDQATPIETYGNKPSLTMMRLPTPRAWTSSFLLLASPQRCRPPNEPFFYFWGGSTRCTTNVQDLIFLHKAQEERTTNKNKKRIRRAFCSVGRL